MPTDDAEMRAAIDQYNRRQTLSDNNSRVLTGIGLCFVATLSWAVSLWACYSVLKDPAVAADFDSGTHDRDVTGRAWTAGLAGLAGLSMVVAATWRGPSTVRWVGVLMLLGGAVVLSIVAFTFLLAQ